MGAGKLERRMRLKIPGGRVHLNSMDKFRRALIFIGGEHPGPGTLARLLPACSLTVAADSGWDAALSLGVRPDVLIGDLDSVRDSGAAGAAPRLIRHPPAKDWSDTELALRFAWGEGYGSAVLFGGGGGRLDHLLAIHALFSRSPAPERWYTATDEIIRIDRKCELCLPQGTVLSLFPLGGGSCRARSSGLRWPLDGLVWEAGDFGLSNEAAGDRQTIEVETGSLLMVRARADDGPLGAVV
jgi:thiamine pyrophosphokinase